MLLFALKSCFHLFTLYLHTQKTILYKRNYSLQDVENPEPSTASIPVVEVSPVLMNINDRFVEEKDLSSTVSTQHQHNGFLSEISANIRQMVTIKKKETVPSQERYRVPNPNISQFKLKIGFT